MKKVKDPEQQRFPDIVWGLNVGHVLGRRVSRVQRSGLMVRDVGLGDFGECTAMEVRV